MLLSFIQLSSDNGGKERFHVDRSTGKDPIDEGDWTSWHEGSYEERESTEPENGVRRQEPNAIFGLEIIEWC